MIELSLQQLFGTNAYQNENLLVIDKRDFTNLSAATNTGEALLTAILLNSYQTFVGTITDESGDAITDNQNQPIQFDNSNLYNLLIEMWKVQILNNKIQHTFLVYQLEEIYGPLS